MAWTASTATLDDAVAQITAAVFRACPDARRVESFATDQGNRYLRFATTGKLGEDNVEILIKNEGLGDRGWEGDQGREREWLVTYRSLATTVKYVYPFMTPVSDLGEQKKRMERIRSEVGWRRVRMRDRGILRQRLVTRRRPPREMNRIDRIEPAARTASIMDDQPARASPSPSPSIFLSASLLARRRRRSVLPPYSRRTRCA